MTKSESPRNWKRVVLKLSGLIEAHNQSKVAVLNMHKTYYERSIWQLKAIEVE